MPAALPQFLRFSTEMLPEHNRLSAFREEFARLFIKTDVVDLSGDNPRFDLTFLALGSIVIGSIAATPCELVRDKHLVKDGMGNFQLHLVDEGLLHTRHAGQEHSYEIGAGVLMDYGRPACTFSMSHGKARNITVPGAALKALVAHPEDQAGHVVRSGPALRLLDSYLASLMALDAPPPAHLSHLVGLHLLDLVAAVLGPTAEGQELITGRGLKAASLHAILAEIARRFSDPSFNIDSMASRLGMSRRNIQRLLEETGKSFTEHVTELRLRRAYEMLSSSGLLHLRIIDIAFDTGFSDISHFNHKFRQRFGETPSGVRAAVGRDRKS